MKDFKLVKFIKFAFIILLLNIITFVFQQKIMGSVFFQQNPNIYLYGVVKYGFLFALNTVIGLTIIVAIMEFKLRDGWLKLMIILFAVLTIVFAILSILPVFINPFITDFDKVFLLLPIFLVEKQ